VQLQAAFSTGCAAQLYDATLALQLTLQFAWHVCCAVLCCGWQAVKVNSLGKWKTALQMTSMSMLLFCKDETGGMEGWLQGNSAVCQGVCLRKRLRVLQCAWGMRLSKSGQSCSKKQSCTSTSYWLQRQQYACTHASHASTPCVHTLCSHKAVLTCLFVLTVAVVPQACQSA
jgi:phosphatidylglycerophosphate synthase